MLLSLHLASRAAVLPARIMDMNPFSKRPDLEQLAEEAIAELVASGEFLEYSGDLPAAARRRCRQLKMRSDDEYLLEDIFSDRMIALTRNSYVEEVTDENLDETLLKPSHERLVMADIYSDACRPCNLILPAVYQLAEKYRDALKVVKINAPRNARFSETFLGPIQVTPAFLFFRNGQPLEISSSRLGRLFGQRAYSASTRAGLEKRIVAVLSETG
jgi:thiol-disulfide isomerase/thioredoxin